MSVIQRKKVPKKGIELKQNVQDTIKQVSAEEKPVTKITWSFTNILKNVLKGMALIILIPAFLNLAALNREEKQLQPSGIYVDVGNGQKLFKTCMGEGKPTVILDAPLGETSDVWSVLQPAIAKFTKVCSYDRSGIGYSDRLFKGNETKKSGKPHTVERMVEDFHKVFEGEEKPFILVGADLGAIVSKFYTQIFPDAVASLVFINPIFDSLFAGKDNPWTSHWFNSHLPSLQLQHICSALGLTRIGLQTGMLQSHLNYPETSDTIKNRQKYLRCKPGHMSSIVEESYFLNESLSQVRMLQKLRPIPSDLMVSVITTEKYSSKIPKERNMLWVKSQELFMETLSKNKVHSSKIRGYLPQVLFSSTSQMVYYVRRSVEQWRNQSQKTAKY